MLSTKGNKKRRTISFGFLLRKILPLVLLIVGAVAAFVLVETSPQIQTRTPARESRLVEVRYVSLSDENTGVNVMGTVKPVRQVVLHPQITGRVIRLSEEFIPGGRFKEGELILQIDPSDYEFAVRQRTSDLIQARSDLRLEMGQQDIAEREYEMLGEIIREEDRDFVLRQPQLDKARSVLENAQAALDQAKLNLERTAVKAPFDLTVITQDVNVGTQLNTTTPLATVVGTDGYWVEVTVPVEQLKWITIPGSIGETGSEARIFNDAGWGTGEFREGRVVRLLGDLEEDGRMARLLIRVDDPLSLEPEHKDKPPLILGSFVRVEIEGVGLNSVVAVERKHVHNGNEVWIMNDNDELEIRTVDIVFRGRDRLYIGNRLYHGERLVTTLLSAPVEGMKLRTSDDRSELPVGHSVKFPTGSAKE